MCDNLHKRVLKALEMDVPGETECAVATAGAGARGSRSRVGHGYSAEEAVDGRTANGNGKQLEWIGRAEYERLMAAANQQQQHQEALQQQRPVPKQLAVAKTAPLAKNASVTDLSEYINPVLMSRRRSSLHYNAMDPTMKRLRQKEAYKTAMCQAWLEGKKCVFGDNCNFAHGEEDLQPLPANRPNPKYKTRICENYTQTGICPFGLRCFFIHPKPSAADAANGSLDYNNEAQPAQKVQAHHLLEGNPIYNPLARGPVGTSSRGTIGPKNRQLRKTETCGNFNIDPHGRMEQLDYGNFRDHFPPLAQTIGMEQKQQMEAKNLKRTMAGSMPLIHSNSASNLYFRPFPVKQHTTEVGPIGSKRIEELRLTMRKMQQQKSFSSSDVYNRDPNTLFEKQEESDSSGPHTPPGFYPPPGLSQLNCWSSNSLSNAGAGMAPPRVEGASGRRQKVPAFSVFGPSFDQGLGGGGGEIEREIGVGLQVQRGKRSPIDFDSVLRGRRNSHTPLLEEDEKESLLSVFEQGMQKAKNKSAEYLCGREGGGAGGNTLCPEDSWQLGTRSTGALNEQARMQTQFGPPEAHPWMGPVAENNYPHLQHSPAAFAGAVGHQQHQPQEFAPIGGLGSAFQPIRKPLLPPSAASQFESPGHSVQSSTQSIYAAGFLGVAGANATRQIWASSSPELDAKNEGSREQEQSWNPWKVDHHHSGVQQMHIPNRLTVAKHSDTFRRIFGESRNDTLTNEEEAEEAKQAEERWQEEQLLKLCDMRISEQPNGGKSAPEKEAKSSVTEQQPAAAEEIPKPTWAQLVVKKKAFLRQKSHSSPSITPRNCSAHGKEEEKEARKNS